VLGVLGLEPAAGVPPPPPRAHLTRKTRAALKDMARLNSRLAGMDRHDRDVAFRLERRRLKLAQCDRNGCRAASPEDMQERRMLSELQAADNRRGSALAQHPGGRGGSDAHEHTEVVRNNYRTSSGGQSPKGVGTARIGDPVLNKHDKSIYERRCEQDGNCITSDWRTLSNEWQHDDNHRMRQRFWRHTKQVDRSMDISADEDMKAQLDKIISDTEKTIDECRQQFAIVSDEAVVHCEHRAVRHTCYIFESQSQLCDAASASRHNHFDGTVYFAKSGLPKACQSQQRKHLMRLCRSAEKLPGIAMSHWPWQVSRPLLRCVLLPARDPPFCPLLHTLHPQAGWARKRRWPMVDCCVCVVRLSITLGRMSDVLLA